MEKDKLRDKLTELIQPKGEEPQLRAWIAEEDSEGSVRVRVNPEFKGEEFMLASDIIKYIDWLDRKDKNSP